MPDALATGLGWFSLGLGLAEVVAPRLVTRALGLEGREGLVRGYGLREMAAGAGGLATKGAARAPWMWSRVGGDALDIAAVAGALNRRGAPRGAIGAALVALAGVTLVDAYCARRLSGGPPRRGSERPRLAPPHARGPGYVRYSDAVEAIGPDEERVIAAIVRAMEAGAERVRERHGRALRASHAKPHGLLRGELRVEPGLPPELRQGFFAEVRSLPVIVRLAQVLGETLPGHAGETTQDFVLDTGKAFISATAGTFLAAIAATEAATPRDPPRRRERSADPGLGASPRPPSGVRRRGPALHRPRPHAGRGRERRVARGREPLPPRRAADPAAAAAQDAERQRAIDEDLLFRPSHSLAAHRPLGSVMRARMRAYEALGRRRREHNGRPLGEPRGTDARPAAPPA